MNIHFVHFLTVKCSYSIRSTVARIFSEINTECVPYNVGV